jgi:uncharacterized protein (TIGR00369 family)
MTDDEIRALLSDPSRHPPCARHLGFELIDFSVGEGWAEVAFNPRPEFANPAGVVQGGFVCAMLDDVMSVAASISQRFAVIVPTLQTSVSYLRGSALQLIGSDDAGRAAGSQRLSAGCRHGDRRSSGVPQIAVAPRYP